jgi:hypothetical protein
MDAPGSSATGGVQVVERYPEKDLLMSGWLIGEAVIAGRAAVLTVPLGKGQVVLLGFRTQHRGQPHATFKLLFNALYLGASGRKAPETPLSGVNE